METGLADFQSFFNEKVRARGLTLRKLSEASGIPLRHLEHLSEGYYEKLPGAPYLQGYLRALGRTLDFDPEPWRIYFRELDLVKSAGAADRLPDNRFAFRSFPKYTVMMALGLLVLAYFGLRFSEIFGKPVLSVEFPPAETVRLEEQVVSVRGRVSNTDQLSVNSEQVIFAEDGSWIKDISLQPGLNTIEVVARKFLGRETKLSRQVIYELPLPSESGPSTIQPEPEPAANEPEAF